MDLTLLLLLSSAILAQGYGKSGDPNDEPFLPIHPDYPYSPKLIKRGIQKEAAVPQLSPELYAPRVDSKDSYSASYGNNYPRDLYYSNYDQYSKLSLPSDYAYQATVPYPYPSAGYNGPNSYSSPYVVPTPPYAGVPYNSYPAYYYQPPYYYPNYYSQLPLPAAVPPPLPSQATGYPTGPYYDSSPVNGDKVPGNRPDEEKSYEHDDGDRFVDGSNRISDNSKDLDGQSSSYDAMGPQNQLEQSADPRTKQLPIPLPRTTYRVISVAGQPVGPGYPLPAPYAKAQRLEELMSRAWATLLAQDLRQIALDSPQRANPNRSSDKPRYVSVPSVAKTGLAFVANPAAVQKSHGTTAGRGVRVSTTRLNSIEYSPVNPSGHPTIGTGGKDRAESAEYETYEASRSQASRDYDGSSGQADKEQPSYQDHDDQGPAVPYQSENYVTVHTPSGHGYRYTDYGSSRPVAEQQPPRYQDNFDDANFGAKTKGP